MDAFRRGDSGAAVDELRLRLVRVGLLPVGTPFGAGFDDDVDSAVRAFQQHRGLSVDGLVGPETFRALEEARWRLGDRVLSLQVRHPFTGDDVAALQARLLELGFDAGRTDGIFGTRTDRALREFQRNVGLRADGTCGPRTLRALRQLSRSVVGGSPNALRESEALRRAGPTLLGKSVVVDPGHGGADRGARGAGTDEAALVSDIAARLEARLAAQGVTAFLSHGPDTAPSDRERADFANRSGADLLVSIHVDEASSPRCEGVATFYFGTPPGAGSVVGERLAGLVQREVVARTGLLDCRIHGKSWELLRLTAMPAVRLELGYLSSGCDAARLLQPAFRDRAADAVMVAVQRLYLPAELDATTGRLRLPALAAG